MPVTSFCSFGKNTKLQAQIYLMRDLAKQKAILFDFTLEVDKTVTPEDASLNIQQALLDILSGKTIEFKDIFYELKYRDYILKSSDPKLVIALHQKAMENEKAVIDGITKLMKLPDNYHVLIACPVGLSKLNDLFVSQSNRVFVVATDLDNNCSSYYKEKFPSVDIDTVTP